MKVRAGANGDALIVAGDLWRIGRLTRIKRPSTSYDKRRDERCEQ